MTKPNVTLTYNADSTEAILNVVYQGGIDGATPDWIGYNTTFKDSSFFVADRSNGASYTLHIKGSGEINIERGYWNGSYWKGTPETIYAALVYAKN